jgi:hypothetical protein
LPPSREYENGRWFNHTVLTKDTWIHVSANAHILERLALESNSSLKSRGVNEFGDPTPIRKRFYKNDDCRNAYRNLFCWINFPRCNMLRNISLETCSSACENYFKSCGFERDIWRCGPSTFFNGYAPEAPTSDSEGNPVYLRDYFPGQPFAENKFNLENLPLPICTPAIDGSGYSLYNMFNIVMFQLAICCFAVLSFV